MARENQTEKTQGKAVSSVQSSQSPETVQAPTGFNRIYQDDIVIEDDVFKCHVAIMLKNISYQKFQPRFEKAEHCHFFHSSDMKGSKMRYTHPVGGHFHEITIIGKDANGRPVAKCGPAVTKISRTTKSGSTKTEVVQVAYYDGNTETSIPDDHTHPVEYIFTTHISQNEVKKRQARDAERFHVMQAGGSPGVTPVGGVEITEMPDSESNSA